jgi:hypothetical protein
MCGAGVNDMMFASLNQTARAFNWAFQASSQLVYFLQHPSGK